MEFQAVSKRNKAGILLSRPYSLWNSGLVCTIIRFCISLITSLVVFDMLMKGFYIECDYVLMHRIIFLSTAVFSLFQLNDVVLVLFVAVLGSRTYTYINANTEVLKNGIMTMANQGYSVISTSLNLPPADGFDKVLSDTYLTVNSVCGIFAVILSVIIVIITVRLCSRILYALGMGLLFAVQNLTGFSTDSKHVFVLLLMFGAVLIMGSSRFVPFRLGIARIVGFLRKKKNTMNQNVMYTIQAGIITLVLFAASFGLISHIYNEEKFQTDFTDDYSDNIKTTARDIAVMKYAEYKKYTLIENVSLGQMGYMSYVKPNKDRNLFSFVTEPVREGKLYFESFVGQDYHYRYNSWTEAAEDNSVMVNALKAAGSEGKEYELSKSDYTAYPYYTDKNEIEVDDKGVSRVTAYEYKPVTINDKEYTDSVYSTYLNVDEENKAVLDKIIAQQGLSADMPDLTAKIKAYFDNNFTYTLEQESLPYGKDFVNYFLEETKSGNFMHYASAITLLYRELGIPARYVSGYAVEAQQTLAGKRASTNRTRTETKQLNMYSWVETYSSQGGWQVIDIVNSPDLETLNEKYDTEESEEYTPDTDLDSYFRTVDREKYSRENIVKTTKNAVSKTVIYVVLIILVLVVFLIALLVLKNYIVLARADLSGRAFIIMERLRKRLGSDDVGYSSMLDELTEVYGRERAEKITQLAQKCVFAQNIKKSEYKRLKKLCAMTPVQYFRALGLKYRAKIRKVKNKK